MLYVLKTYPSKKIANKGVDLLTQQTCDLYYP